MFYSLSFWRGCFKKLKGPSGEKLFLVKLSKDISTEFIMENNEEILIIEPNFIYKSYEIESDFDFKPRDEKFPQQWSFQNTKQRLDQRYQMTLVRT